MIVSLDNADNLLGLSGFCRLSLPKKTRMFTRTVCVEPWG